MTERGRFEDHSLVQLTLCRFREFWREPEAVFWVFIFPILLTAGLGIAFRNKPPDMLRVGVASADVQSLLTREPELRVEVLDRAAAEDALRMGRITLYASGTPGGPLTFRFDDTNPDGRMARLLAERALNRAQGNGEGAAATDELVREPGSRYIDFLVPGLLGMNLMSSGIWGLGFTIVDARKKKLLKRLIASPMPRAQYLLSFLISRLVTVTLEITVLVGFGVWVFGVPMRGRFFDLALICLLGAICFSSLGLLIASRARTIEAASGLINLVMLPMWICSGVFFSAERFPDAILPLIRVLPLTAAIDALRANMLQGVAFSHLAAPLSVMTAWLVVCFFSALKFFRWR